MFIRSTRTLFPCMFFSILAFLASSCAPGGPQSFTVRLYTQADLSGSVSLDDTDPVNSYTAIPNPASAAIGDNGNNVGYSIIFVSFDFSDIPVDATIVSATLRMHQNGQSSGDSYGLGGVLVDNVSYLALEGRDEMLDGFTTGSDIGIGPLAESYVADSWHELDVTVSAEDELADYHNGRLQFRIYHNIENDNDNVNDTDGWTLGNGSNRPELVVTYLN